MSGTTGNGLRRRDRNGEPRTLYALAESTRLAWERVRQSYATGGAARPYSFTDVRRGYGSFDPLTNGTVVFVLCLALVAYLAPETYKRRSQIIDLVFAARHNVFEILVLAGALCVCLIAYSVRKPRTVYLLDSRTFIPPKRLHVNTDRYMATTLATKRVDEESAAFQKKLLGKSGIGTKSAFPASILEHCDEIPKAGGDVRAVCNMQYAREEAELVVFGALDELFLKNRLDPKSIDILIVNCSLFNPTPSLSAMIVNKYKMRTSVLTYNLAGMGCSAGLISIDLAKDLLQVHRNATAVVVSTENITQNWYLGRERSMLITNTLFRMGCAAILLSNRRSDAHRARYKLKCTVRTHIGSDDLAYDCIFQMEDKEGIRGVKLSKNIMDVADKALKKNITTLAPLTFPLSEHIKFFFYLFKKKVMRVQGLPAYYPDFHKAFQHFCIHTGGRAVIDVMQTALKLSQYDLAPSRYALKRYGNTSSASVWYELRFIEDSGRVKAGDCVWQIAFGSGFKCNSAVWVAMCDIEGDPNGVEEA